MTIKFSIDEIFEMAEKIETNGAKFYRKAMEHVKGGETRQMLEKLANMEIEHKKTFSDMRSRLANDDQDRLVFDPDDQAGMYIRAIADGKVFDINADPSELLSGSETAREIIKIALAREKDTIVFFTGLKGGLPSGEEKEKVDFIIREEMNHIVILNEHLDSL